MRYKQKYTKECLERAVKKSASITGVMRDLGIKESGGNHTHIKSLLSKYEIDCGHFTGQAWNKGKLFKFGPEKLSSSDILVENRLPRRERVDRLRRAMIEVGMKHCCNRCGLTKLWNNLPLVLEINHIDQNFLNNKKDNLEFLCPNCHSQHTQKVIA